MKHLHKLLSMKPIEKTNTGLRVELPNSLGGYDSAEMVQLSKLRNHINGLEAQVYYNEIVAMFETHPDLLAIRIENTDNADDNGRHVSIISEDTVSGADWGVIDQDLEERVDTLNHSIRHRGIYDYLDELISIGILSRDKLQDKLGKAYDAVAEDLGAWARLRSEQQALHLEGATSSAMGNTKKPRM